MSISLDLNTNLFLVQDGVVAPILKTPILSSMIPPIEPYIKDLKFRFNATGMVRTLITKATKKGSTKKKPCICEGQNRETYLRLKRHLVLDILSTYNEKLLNCLKPARMTLQNFTKTLASSVARHIQFLQLANNG